MEVTFVERNPTTLQTPPQGKNGCIAIELNGQPAGFLIRDLPEHRGGRWYCTASPTCRQARHLHAAGLHDRELSRDLNQAKATVLYKLDAYVVASNQAPPGD